MIVHRSHTSPNFNRRRQGSVVNAIVMHADGDASVASTITYMATVASKVSYHAVVGRLGDIYELVDPVYRAWHAGVSALSGVNDCNTYSVGVCLSNRQDGTEQFTEPAINAAAEYCAAMMVQFPAITLDRIVMHSDVALPKGRKVDPYPAEKSFHLIDFRAIVHGMNLKTAA